MLEEDNKHKKSNSEKIFDILGSLVADPFRRWLIVGYVIFNPDLFVLFFTSEEKFEIFQQYFKFQYYHWLSSAIGDYFSLRIHAIYQFLSWPLYHIIFPFLFSYFWCFAYPRFEIWYRERTKENQDKIKDIKDNNILQNEIKIKDKSLKNAIVAVQLLFYSIPEQDRTLFWKADYDFDRKYFPYQGRSEDSYKHCMTTEAALKIKNYFGLRTFEHLIIDQNIDSWTKEKCISFLGMIKIFFVPKPNIMPDYNYFRNATNHLIDEFFIILVWHRLSQLIKNENDKSI